MRMIISTEMSDCFDRANIELEHGKEYLVYIASCFASSYPIVQLYSKHNPIFICKDDVVDAPKHNFVTLSSESRARIASGDTSFMKTISESSFLAKLLAALKKHQRNVWVKTFENGLGFNSIFDDNVKSLGLTSAQSHKWNNKVEQYRRLENLVPIADFIITSRDAAIHCFDKLASPKGVFTSLPRGEQGDGVRLHADKEHFQSYLRRMRGDELIVVTALSVKSSLSIDVIIANEDEVLVYGLSEQLMDGLACLGGVSPVDLDPSFTEKCYDIANTVGVRMAEDGVRGIVNIDLVLDDRGSVYFCEINARYSGTTHIRMLALEQAQPSSGLSIVDLEIMALKEGTFNGNQLPSEVNDAFWYKKEIYPTFSGEVRDLNTSNDALRLAQLGKGAVIVGQRKQGSLVVKNKTTLGNLICVGRTKEELAESIRRGNELVEHYVPEA